MSYFRFSNRFVGKSGLEPLNSEEDRFTVCCNCHYATSPLPPMPVGIRRSSRWRDSNPRQADYKSATLPTELHRLLSTFQTTLFLCFEVAKILLFHKLKNFFSTFFHCYHWNNWFTDTINFKFLLLFLSNPAAKPTSAPLKTRFFAQKFTTFHSKYAIWWVTHWFKEEWGVMYDV